MNRQLKIGIAVESEHVPDLLPHGTPKQKRKLAIKIAKRHLKESRTYYDDLLQYVEKESAAAIEKKAEKTFGKSRAFPIGTVRNWGGRQHRKIAVDKWQEVQRSRMMRGVTGGGNSAKDIEDVKPFDPEDDDTKRFVRESMETEGKEFEAQGAGDVTDRQIKDAKEIEHSIDIKKYKHVITSRGLRHIHNEHGVGNETDPVQRPVTVDDVLKIPDIINKYNKMEYGGLSEERGLVVLKFIKKYANGEEYFYLAEINPHDRNEHKKNKGVLIPKTMFIKRNVQDIADAEKKEEQPKKIAIKKRAALPATFEIDPEKQRTIKMPKELKEKLIAKYGSKTIDSYEYKRWAYENWRKDDLKKSRVRLSIKLNRPVSVLDHRGLEPAHLPYMLDDKKQPWQMTRFDYVSEKQYKQQLHRTYFDKHEKRIAESSRTTPQDESIYDFPLGTWMLEDDYDHERYKPSQYGTRIFQLREVPFEHLVYTEDKVKKNIGHRRDDAKRYADWIREGSVPPPIKVFEGGDGKLYVFDGHRRAFACYLAHAPIRAWVCPLTEIQYDHKKQRVEMTAELSIRHAMESNVAVAQPVLDFLSELKADEAGRTKEWKNEDKYV